MKKNKNDNEYFHQLDPYIENLTEDELRILENRSKVLNGDNRLIDDSEHISTLVFSLSDETYALESEFVIHTIENNGITSLPGISDYFAGIINLRGNIIPIYYLNKLLGLDVNSEVKFGYIIVMNKQNDYFGLLVQEIKGVENILTENITTDIILGNTNEEFIKGVTSNNIILLDNNKIINDERLILK